MKGVVFTELIEMIEARHSVAMADAVIEDAQLRSGGAYTAVGTYDHRELGALLAGLSARTGTPVAALLEAFGQHLFGRFVAAYPAFFVDVPDALTFLAGVEDVIHAEVQKLYPDAELPRFDCARPGPDELIMEYRSERDLADLAAGLIAGCVAHFGEPIEVERARVAGAPPRIERFTLRRRGGGR